MTLISNLIQNTICVVTILFLEICYKSELNYEKAAKKNKENKK